MAEFQLVQADASLGQEYPDLGKVRAYLQVFGYLREDTPAGGILDPVTSAALARFQEMFGIEASGSIDAATRAALTMPRCGVPDGGPGGGVAKPAPYVPIGCDYHARHRTLTYRFDNSTPDLPGDAERDAVRRAFATWAKVIPVDFVEVGPTNAADLKIGWATGNHGDGASFDGPGAILAHAFYPPSCGGSFAGHCHFDEGENWGLAHGAGNFDLETVAVHEIGHLLGLAHSNGANSVMVPGYAGQRRVLSTDDVAGIQSLYGKPGPALRVRAHLEGYGDRMGRESEFIGTRGEYRRLEGFQIEIATPVPNLSLQYMAHLEGIGDTPMVPEGNFVGTRGQHRRLEGFTIELTGSAAGNYNLFYLAHLQGIGDTPLMTGGNFCGTRGQSRRVEGILVRIEPK